MMLYPLFICVLFVATFVDSARGQQCTANRQKIVLGFDDIGATNTGVPQPYNTFMFTRGGDWTYNNVPVINTLQTGVPAFYIPAASSPPNVILSQTEPLFIKQVAVPSSGNPTFVLRSLSMFSLYLNSAMNISITLSKDGVTVATQYVSLPFQRRIPVTLTKLVNADMVTIACVSRIFGVTCDYVAYDDFEFCYNPLK